MSAPIWLQNVYAIGLTTLTSQHRLLIRENQIINQSCTMNMMARARRRMTGKRRHSQFLSRCSPVMSAFGRLSSCYPVSKHLRLVLPHRSTRSKSSALSLCLQNSHAIFRAIQICYRPVPSHLTFSRVSFLFSCGAAIECSFRITFVGPNVCLQPLTCVAYQD